LILAVVVFGAVGGIYYYSSKTEVVVSEKPTVAPANNPISKPQVDHGDFQKRFEPKMPSSDSSKPK
jgi:hypothetical protein